jgi:hypoxanthine phosphoribosyltransferase
MNEGTLAQALKHSVVVHDRQVIEETIARMSVRIRNDFAGSVPVYLTVMHGGMPFASQLALELGARGLDLEFDYLHATRYRGAQSGGTLHWKHRPRRRCAAAACCWSTTSSTKATRCRKCANGAERRRRRRAHRRARGEGAQPLRAGLTADYAGLVVPDRYVYGYGMDYHEQGRNLPAIYALE